MKSVVGNHSWCMGVDRRSYGGLSDGIGKSSVSYSKKAIKIIMEKCQCLCRQTLNTYRKKKIIIIKKKKFYFKQQITAKNRQTHTKN